MLPIFVLDGKVSYADVDRDELMSLPRIFKLLQEAAIMHASQFGLGTQVMAARAEGWVLNRIGVALERYPRHEERLRVETWSRGITGFKGERDFRIYDAESRPIVRASSVWLYVSLKTKSIVRLSRAVAEGFPVGNEDAWCPELPQLRFPEPAAAARVFPITLRYSDVDVHQHVNNAAYVDLVQTAFARSGVSARPRQLFIKYAQALPADIDAVELHVDVQAAGAIFSVRRLDTLFAVGRAEV